MKPIDRSYLAAIIDGEGHIIIGNRSRTYGRWKTIAIGVTNTDRRLMWWLKRELGGSISSQRPKSLNRKKVWKWAVEGERAAIIIRGLLPYLKLKATRGKKTLVWWEKSIKRMQRPKRREFHINKEKAAMRLRGWD